LEKIYQESFFDNVNKVQGLELTKKILENLSLVKDHPNGRRRKAMKKYFKRQGYIVHYWVAA